MSDIIEISWKLNLCFENLQLSNTRDNTIDICCFSANHSEKKK
jgi:hypothetical protein